MAMRPARVLLTRHPTGRPLSAPFDIAKYQTMLKAGLNVFETATAGVTVIEIPGAGRTGPFGS